MIRGYRSTEFKSWCRLFIADLGSDICILGVSITIGFRKYHKDEEQHKAFSSS